jgi:hypothetical protein
MFAELLGMRDNGYFTQLTDCALVVSSSSAIAAASAAADPAATTVAASRSRHQSRPVGLQRYSRR